MRVDINPRYESLGARIYRAAYPDGDDFIPTMHPSPKPAASPELRAALDTVPGWREVTDKLRWLLTTAAAYTPPPAVDNGRLFGGVDSDPGAPRRAILAGVDAPSLAQGYLGVVVNSNYSRGAGVLSYGDPPERALGAYLPASVLIRAAAASLRTRATRR